MTKKVKQFLNNYFIIFIAILAVAGYFSVVLATGVVDEGFVSLTGNQITVDAHGDCQTVNNTSGINYFVPTRTNTEWQAFQDNLPSNVTLGACCSNDCTLPSTACALNVLYTCGECDADSCNDWCWSGPCPDNVCKEPTCAGTVCGENNVAYGGVDESCDGALGCAAGSNCMCDGNGNCWNRVDCCQRGIGYTTADCDTGDGWADCVTYTSGCSGNWQNYIGKYDSGVDICCVEADCGANSDCIEAIGTRGTCNCTGGYFDCNNNYWVDGCECGLPNTECQGNSCVCIWGYDDCTAAAGCETAVYSNDSNCGSCGNSCGGAGCFSGSCCTPNSYTDCGSGGNIYWFSSCGVQQGLAITCINSACSDGNCVCTAGLADCNGDGNCECNLSTSGCSGGSCQLGETCNSDGCNNNCPGPCGVGDDPDCGASCCGDGNCDPGETCGNCWADCGCDSCSYCTGASCYSIVDYCTALCAMSPDPSACYLLCVGPCG